MKKIVKSAGRQGISVEDLRAHFFTTDEQAFLKRVAELVRSGEVYELRGRLFSEKPKPGRPYAENPRESVTVRLPADMVTWLRSKNNYTAVIEEALRPVFEAEKRSEADQSLDV